MGKIFYFMGKSASGKDTIFKEIQKRFSGLKTIVLYTTRPKREGEKNGVEYFFVNEEERQKLCAQGTVIESRVYETVCGPWYYFTVDDGQVDLEAESCLMMGTLESYEKIRAYYGEDRVVPIYIEVEDGERLARALARERKQNEPKYAELCRRFLADREDFSEEKLQDLGIRTRYDNSSLECCINKISEKISEFFP